MEHDILTKWCSENGIQFEQNVRDRLIKYASMIESTNRIFNLTGFKNLNDIMSELIVGSLDPLSRLDVPRGTSFADIGSGSGIPGVPLSIVFGNIEGVVIEANGKKTEFIQNALFELGIDNLSVLNSRIEEAGRWEDYRAHFDYVFSRALGNAYFCLELGAPLLKRGGLLYIYSAKDMEKLPKQVLLHAEMLGMEPVKNENHFKYGFSADGILFEKKGETPSEFPRNFPIIKREARKYD